MIAVGYIRRSAKRRKDENVVSLETQRDKITKYCATLGAKLAGFVEHDGVSGTKRTRFDDISEGIRKNGANVLIIYQLDRLARDVSGLSDYLKELTRYRVEVHEATSGKIGGDADGRMVTQFRAVVDEAYASKIGEKTRDALGTLRENGRRFTRIPPLGYSFEQDGTNAAGEPLFAMVPHDDEQK